MFVFFKCRIVGTDAGAFRRRRSGRVVPNLRVVPFAHAGRGRERPEISSPRSDGACGRGCPFRRCAGLNGTLSCYKNTQKVRRNGNFKKKYHFLFDFFWN